MDEVQLSIIVPILNERSQLPVFFENLSTQRDVRLELVICDGGSTDGSLEWLQQQQPDWVELKILQGQPGRGRQLNQGVSATTGKWLLFLHVDSVFADPLALRKGLAHLLRSGSKNVAGHFVLKFRRQDESPSSGYYFYEWKACLERPETIHGDQGFFLNRNLLDKVGAFREDLPAMEDTDFAERLRAVGQWQLLPAEISTSARRFETEGLWQRQLLGALIMCFRDIGWNGFFTAAPDIYRQQSAAGKLQIRPFFSLLRRLFAELGWRERWGIWYHSGAYVRKHAWQLSFAIDARRAFRHGIPVGQGRMTLTNCLEPSYDLLTANLLGRLAATLLLRLWFEVTDIWLRIKERQAQ